MVHGSKDFWYTEKGALQVVESRHPFSGGMAGASGSRNVVPPAPSTISTTCEVAEFAKVAESATFGTRIGTQAIAAERWRRRGYRHEALCAAMEFRVAIDAIAAGDLWVIGRVARG